MQFIVDIAIIAFLVLSLVIGYKRGLIKSVMPVVSFVAAFLLSLHFTPMLSPLICEKYVMPAVKDAAEKNIFENVPSDTDGGDVLKGIELPEFISENLDKLKNIFERWGTDSGKVEAEAEKEADGAESGGIIRNIAGLLSKPVAERISNIITFILLFAVAYIAARLLMFLIGLLFKVPVLSTFNKICGLILGTVEGLFFIWLFTVVISYLIPEIAKVAPTVDMSSFTDSAVFRFFRDNNIWVIVSRYLM